MTTTIDPLTEKLRERGLTQTEFTERVGITRITLWRWRTGRATPTSEAVRRRIAEVLGCDINDIWKGEA